MIWVYPEYGGQIATRFGDYLVMRTKLRNKKQLGQWEAYNLISDPKQSTNIAGTRPDLIERAKAIFAQRVVGQSQLPDGQGEEPRLAEPGTFHYAIRTTRAGSRMPGSPPRAPSDISDLRNATHQRGDRIRCQHAFRPVDFRIP